MSIGNRLKSLKWVLKRKFVYNYQWHRIVRKHLKRYYSEDLPQSTSADRIIVCMADGKRRHGGLADRLRSYVTYYGFCKEHGLRFAINFTSPFNLEDYLEPNRYDWRLKPGELTFNSRQARPLPFQTSGPLTDFEKRQQLKLVEKYVGDENYIQFHMYSNYCFGENDFGKYFNELFRPVPRIAAVVNECKKELGERYISVSTRFLELLGDFKEPKEKLHLNSEEQLALISKCRGEVEKLHDEYPDLKILVTSDSRRFIDACSEFPYVYIPEGNIEHIDVKDQTADHTKTFVDFLLIAGAEKVFQVKCGPMYGGNFSLRAAQAGGKTHKLIES
ncbi:MAG: hypothetical protein HDR88_11265 [Bacteroides sp.]|nr:hypothetical protein [Bacteroides sp.]